MLEKFVVEEHTEWRINFLVTQIFLKFPSLIISFHKFFLCLKWVGDCKRGQDDLSLPEPR